MPIDLRHIAAAAYAVVFFNVISIIILLEAIKLRLGRRTLYTRKSKGIIRTNDLYNLNPTECRNLLRIE
jgi:hypothetical protein